MDKSLIKNLSTEEKIHLAEALWQEIDAERKPLLSATQLALIQQRLKMHEANPHAGKSWEELKAKYYR
jgi:putative addiction module component (TIGR02574 family)